MIYELEDTAKVKHLYDGWQETMIDSCIQKIMGKIYVTDIEQPESALAFAGCFGFFAGKPDRELAEYKPEGFVIFVPQNGEWAKLIEVDTAEPERRKSLALIACSALILRCLDEGLYPSWDAMNMGSVHLAEKLGYEFDHEYTAYEIDSEK